MLDRLIFILDYRETWMRASSLSPGGAYTSMVLWPSGHIEFLGTHAWRLADSTIRLCREKGCFPSLEQQVQADEPGARRRLEALVLHSAQRASKRLASAALPGDSALPAPHLLVLLIVDILRAGALPELVETDDLELGVQVLAHTSPLSRPDGSRAVTIGAAQFQRGVPEVRALGAAVPGSARFHSLCVCTRRSATVGPRRLPRPLCNLPAMRTRRADFPLPPPHTSESLPSVPSCLGQGLAVGG